MRPNQVAAFIKEKTGFIVRPTLFSEWEANGLLGEVPRYKDSTHRNFSSLNARKALLIKILEVLSWSKDEVKRLLKDKEPIMKEKLQEDYKNLSSKIVPSFKELIEGDVI